MFETGGRHREIERFLVVIFVSEQSVDQATHEGVATAHSVYDMGDVVSF